MTYETKYYENDDIFYTIKKNSKVVNSIRDLNVLIEFDSKNNAVGLGILDASDFFNVSKKSLKSVKVNILETMKNKTFLTILYKLLIDNKEIVDRIPIAVRC